MTPLVIGGVHDGKGGIGGLGLGVSTAGMPSNARFDASTFGEKLFSAARDGVERIGSSGSPVIGGPALGGHIRDASVDRVTEGETKASMNENMKNIGKFFRRDMSGFGGRFGGKRDGSVDDTVR